MSGQCMTLVGTILFRVGQIVLLIGVSLIAVAIGTTHWVDRPEVDFVSENIDPNTTVVTRNYGIFAACRQQPNNTGGRGLGHVSVQCSALWETLNFVNEHTIRFIQFCMIIAVILYLVSFILELVQLMPIQKYRNFLAKNRLVEMFAGIGTVLVLTGMVVFAGEVKNKAERVSGQENEKSGWSFIIALMGTIMCVIGLVMVTMLRVLPVNGQGKKGGTWLRVRTADGPNSWGTH